MNLEDKPHSAYKRSAVSKVQLTHLLHFKNLVEAFSMKAHEECLKQFKVILQRL